MSETTSTLVARKMTPPSILLRVLHQRLLWMTLRRLTFPVMPKLVRHTFPWQVDYKPVEFCAANTKKQFNILLLKLHDLLHLVEPALGALNASWSVPTACTHLDTTYPRFLATLQTVPRPSIILWRTERSSTPLFRLFLFLERQRSSTSHLLCVTRPLWTSRLHVTHRTYALSPIMFTSCSGPVHIVTSFV